MPSQRLRRLFRALGGRQTPPQPPPPEDMVLTAESTSAVQASSPQCVQTRQTSSPHSVSSVGSGSTQVDATDDVIWTTSPNSSEGEVRRLSEETVVEEYDTATIVRGRELVQEIWEARQRQRRQEARQRAWRRLRGWVRRVVRWT